MKNNIKNNKKDTLQGMRVVTTMRGCKEDINGRNGEESAKTKKPGVGNRKVYRR